MQKKKAKVGPTIWEPHAKITEEICDSIEVPVSSREYLGCLSLWRGVNLSSTYHISYDS